MDENRLLPLDINPARKINGRSEFDIQHDIEQAARAACANAKSDYEKCVALFDFVSSGIAYRTIDSDYPKRAVQTYADEYGDCDDMAYYYIAAAKAVGIEARIAIMNPAEEKHAAVAVLLPKVPGIEPSSHFESDSSYAQSVVSRFSARQEADSHLYLVDIAKGTFSSQQKMEVMGEATPRLYLNRALYRLGAEDYSGAIVDFDDALLLCKGSAIFGNLVPEILDNKGICMALLGKYGEAIALGTQAMKMEPQNERRRQNLSYAYIGRGNANYNAGKIDNAIADYATANEIYPKNRVGNGNLASCYMKKKDYARAAEYLEKHLRENPKDLQAARELAQVRALLDIQPALKH